jgi:hypothetical protein
MEITVFWGVKPCLVLEAYAKQPARSKRITCWLLSDPEGSNFL